MQTTNSSIEKRVSKSPIAVSRVYKSDFQKAGTLTAELKQIVTTTSSYPTKSISNSLQDNIFGMSEFGFEEKTYKNDETRVAWIDVPANSTAESVAAKLQAHSGACLYRILSNKPIIADTEKFAINNPDMDVDLDTFANRQVVRYPIGAPQEGEIAEDGNGKIQYRRIAFSAVAMSDSDMRTADPADYYASAELAAEFQGETSAALPSQSI